MRAAFFTGRRCLEILDTAEPTLDDASNVILRIDKVGICGSDIHYYQHGCIGGQVLEYPASVGHECAGTVIEVGAGAEGLRTGQRVAVDPAFSCGECDQCRKGRSHTCRNLMFMGNPGQALGAIREYAQVPARSCVPLPDSVSLIEGAMVEPLSVAVHALDLAAFEGQPSVAVLGSGPIGLSCLMTCRAAGVSSVYVTDLLEARLARARQCGAQWTGNPAEEDVVAAILEQEPQGVDFVFECSGDPSCLEQAVNLLTPGGALVITGIPAVDHVRFDIHKMRRRELRLLNVRRQNRCMDPAIRLVSEGRVEVGPLITHHFSLEETQQAFELVQGYRDGVVKTVIHVSEVES